MSQKLKSILKKTTSDKDSINDFEFFKYFQKSSIDRFLKLKPFENFPESWSRIYFKSYARFPTISLTKNFKNDKLLEILFKRRTERNFSNYPITIKEVSYILSGATITKVLNNDFDYYSFRAYPSAGARYPLEIYLFLLNGKNLKRGIYHYNVRFHCLEYMWDITKKDLIQIFGNQKFILNSSLIIFITCIIKRVYPKYGERSLRLALLEAGHLAQNFLLLATKLNLKTCPIGGFKEKKVLDILDISSEEEMPFYGIVIGK